jgi:glycosyltransferase involved in cell wall biosynthesis
MISVIVPVYNTELYLARCLDSLLAQSHQNFEIIIVNDGSVDRSGEIGLEYATKDARVTYYEKENQGVSVARNIGIELSKGDYLLFVDADDYLDSNVLETLSEVMTRESLDCVSYMFRQVYSDSRKPVQDTLGKGDIFYALNTPADIAKFLSGDGRIPFYSACTHLFKRSIVMQYGIRFTENIVCGEDTLFSHTYALFIKKGCILSDFAAYNRFVHPMSCTETKKNKWLYDVFQTLQMCQALYDFLHKHSLVARGSKVLAKMSWELIVSIAFTEVDSPAPEHCANALKKSKTLKHVVYPAIVKYSFLRRKLLVGVFLVSHRLFRWCILKN